MEPKELNEKINDAIEEIPTELVSFLFDGEFDAVFEEYKEKYQDIEKFYDIKNKTFEFLLGIISISELKSTIENSTTDTRLIKNIKNDIQEKIIDEILLILEVHKDMENNLKNINTSPKEEIANIVSRLNQSFTAPTTIIPKKSVYADLSATTPESKPTPEQAPSTSTPKPVIDPYRIDPNEK